MIGNHYLNDKFILQLKILNFYFLNIVHTQNRIDALSEIGGEEMTSQKYTILFIVQHTKSNWLPAKFQDYKKRSPCDSCNPVKQNFNYKTKKYF